MTKQKAFLSLFFIPALCLANMAYWGPPNGNVSGQQVSQNVRIIHEILTADLRQLPGGTVNVFANYRLQCQKKTGIIRFLFVASSEQPAKPEIILDGHVMKVTPQSELMKFKLPDNQAPDMRDSLSQIIGYDLLFGEHRQRIKDQLFTFDVDLDEGEHLLKIGYVCQPTAFDADDLRYTVFPYFLGNRHTRNLYDSIFVKIMLPKDVSYETNFGAKESDGILLSDNIAGFQKSHIEVRLFKDVRTELKKGWGLFMLAQWILWILLAMATMILVRRRTDAGKTFSMTLAFVVPVSIICAAFMYYAMMFYYHHFEGKYDAFLAGNFGKGYHFLIIPVVMIFSAMIWVAFVFIYRYLIYKRAWDPTRLVVKNN